MRVSNIKIIDDDQDYVECVGDELTGAHPKIFLNLKDADGQIECYYCCLLYTSDAADE